jgi:hypothetical protein
MPPLPLRTRRPKLVLFVLIFVAALVSIASAAAVEVRDRGSPAANNDEGLRVAREGDTETAFKLRLMRPMQTVHCCMRVVFLLSFFLRFHRYHMVSSRALFAASILVTDISSWPSKRIHFNHNIRFAFCFNHALFVSSELCGFWIFFSFGIRFLWETVSANGFLSIAIRHFFETLITPIPSAYYLLSQNNLGVAAMRLGRYKTAKRCFETALAQHGPDAAANMEELKKYTTHRVANHLDDFRCMEGNFTWTNTYKYLTVS